MIGQSQDLLVTVAKSMARAAAPGWKRVELSITGVEQMTSTEIRIIREDDSVAEPVGLSHDGHDATAALRKEMYQPGKGTWYNAHLSLESSGKLNADFDYDNRPFDGDVDDVLLLEDHRLFPRDPEHLPTWHPARDRP